MVSNEELKELDLWIRNTWDVEEKELFYSTVFRLNTKDSVKENEEEIVKLRELIIKKYEEYAENYANEVLKYEDSVKDARLEAEELETKLNNKENYLIQNFPIAIINANLENIIENCNKEIEKCNQKKDELVESKKEEKEELEKRLSEIEEELASLRVKNISATDEELELISKKYNDLLEEKSTIDKSLNGQDENSIQTKLEEINKQIKFQEIKKKKYEEIKEENLRYANESQYDNQAIKADKEKLAELKSKIEEADNYQINNGNTDFIDIFDRYISSKENPIIDEDPVKVVKTTKWEWVKEHKKQILIALGLTALAISVVVLATQVLPALVAANNATQTAGLMSQMVSNGSLWHAASVGEQAALHSANIALANQVTAVTGMSNAFNAATGVWTIGGQTLTAAANAASIAATKAAGTATLLQGLGIATGLGGVGLIGAGLLPKASQEYKKINEEIKYLKDTCTLLDEIKFQNMAQTINDKINSSNKLSSIEIKILLKKFASVLRKRAKYNAQQQEINELEEQQVYALEEFTENKVLELAAAEPVDIPKEKKAVDKKANVIDVGKFEMLEDGNIYEVDENGNIILPNEEKAKSM